MTAQTPVLTGDAAIVAEIEALQQRLESLADAGDWSGFAIAMQRRDELLPMVAVNDRANLFAAVMRANDRMLKLAKAKRQDIADQLVTLRRGRDMAGRYASHRAMPDGTQ